MANSPLAKLFHSKKKILFTERPSKCPNFIQLYIIQFIREHGPFASYLFRFKVKEEPML